MQFRRLRDVEDPARRHVVIRNGSINLPLPRAQSKIPRQVRRNQRQDFANGVVPDIFVSQQGAVLDPEYRLEPLECPSIVPSVIDRPQAVEL